MVMRLAEIVLFFKKIRESNQSKFKSNEQTAAPDPLDRNRTHALSAFRTILLMLSLIQSRKRITAKSPNSESVKAELKPLDALAAIAIRKHGVAAVVAKSHDGSEDIQVLASVSSSDQPKELLTSPQPLPSGGLKWIEFVTTRNARTEKDRRMQATQPVLVDPETKIPEILKESQDLLTTYLQHEWQKREETSESSFHIHMWMINKLLVQARRNSDKRSLTNYIIASCYQRMLTRLDYRTSESYLKAFTTLTTIDYTEQPHAEQPHTTQHDITRRSEFANDQSFLTNLNRYMPLLDLRSKIPNLALKAKHPDRVDQLYTKETCTEFHLLLCELLERFSDGLKELHNLRGHETDPEEIVKVLNSITLNGSLVRSMIKGGAIKKHLQVIENFLPDMPFGNQTEGDVGDEPEVDDVDDVDDVDELDEVADLDSGEQEALVEAQLLPKWKRCRVWLELLMIHFDSAQILVGFLKRYDPNINLDIKVLTLPLPPSDMLTWRELLKDIGPPLSLDGIMNFLEPDIESESVTDVSNKETQGPTTKTVLRDSSIKSESITGEKGMEGPAAERIWKTKGSTAGDATGKKGKERPAAKAVLQDSEVDSGKMKGPTGEDVLRLVMALSKIPQVTANLKVFADAVDEVCAQLKAVTNCSSPLAAAYTSNIVKRLQSFKDMWIYTSQDDSTGVLAKIAREIRTLRDNGRFHEALRKGSPLDTGTGCKGACHCEAALAAFCCLHPEWGKFKAIRAIGVSKRCCPACAHLLKLFPEPFHFTHSHNTLSSCSLPDSLPLDIIAGMILKFGGQLIEDLIDLKRRTSMLESVDPSIGSGTLSVGSDYLCEDLFEGPKPVAFKNFESAE